MEEAQSAALAQSQPEGLTPEQLKKVRDLAGSIHIEDSQAVLQFGVDAQRRISDFSDSMLEQIRSKDSGEVTEVLISLMRDVRSLDVDSIAEQPKGFFARLFFSLKRRMRRFAARYDTLSVEIERTLRRLDAAKMRLLRDITLLDGMYAKNLEYMQALDLYILAGAQKLAEINDTLLTGLKRQAEQTGDPALAQKYEDMAQLANRFEKKLHDLKLSRMISMQTGPQLRIIQNNDQALAEKIQSSILNTIPLWKNQVIIAVSLSRQKSALKMQRQVSSATHELLTRNSKLLKENSIGIARESQQGIVELETLQKAHRELIATFEETLQIQEEGRTRRMRAEEALSSLEADLKQKLPQIRQHG